MRRPAHSNCDRAAADSPPISSAIRAAAADWIARRDAGLSAHEQLEYSAWLDGSPAHRMAVERLDFAWKMLDRPLATGSADAVLSEIAQRARQRRQRRTSVFKVASLALLLGAGFGWQALRPPSDLTSPAVASAVVLLPSIQSLPDGSLAELRDGAEIAVEFTETQRRVFLRRGEVYFKVATNPARPFIVAAGGVEVRAVGTAFTVDLGISAVDVLVTEGKVAVMAPRSAAQVEAENVEPLMVAAGHGTTVRTSAQPAPPELLMVAADDLQARLAWRSARLEFSGTPLIEAVALLNQHNHVQFTIEDRDLARMRVSGIFRAVNTDAFVRLLESSFGVQSERRGTDEIVLRRKP
jgi:transmembrane sensor